MKTYMRRHLLGVYIIVACAACSSFPVGPKHIIRNWETPSTTVNTPQAISSRPVWTATPASKVDSSVTMFPSISTSVGVTTTSSPVTTTPAGDVEVEYAYPTPVPFTPGSARTEFGIQINGCDFPVEPALDTVQRMHLTWVKQQARWGNIETAPSVFDWSCLDRVIPAAHLRGLKVLVSITTAPVYTRQVYQGIFHATNGRPEDFRNLAMFVAQLILRYPHQIQAIEIWNEPNLMAEWGDALDGAVYAQLLAVGYGITKYLDPGILVISAGLATVDFSTPWEVLDDRAFLTRLFEYQGTQYADCIGAHANGPDGSGDIDVVAARYYELAGRQKPICVTEFGYALPVDGQAPEGFAWIMAHTPARQAEVLAKGVRWASGSGYTRLVILWNLNYSSPHTNPNAPYALARPGWESPALKAVALVAGGP